MFIEFVFFLSYLFRIFNLLFLKSKERKTKKKLEFSKQINTPVNKFKANENDKMN